MMNSGSTTATSPSHTTPLITDHRDSDNNPSSDGSSSSSPTDANKVPSYVNLARCVNGYSSFTSYTSPARREYSPARRDFSPIGRPASTSNQRHRDTSLSRLDKPLSPCREHLSQDNVILLSPSKENFVKNSFDTTRGRHTLDNRENLSPGSGSQPVGGDQHGITRRVGRTLTGGGGGGGGGLFNVMAEQSPIKPSRSGLLGDTGSTTTSSGFFTSPSRSSRYTSNSRTPPPSGLPLSPPSSNGVGSGGLNSTALVVDVNRLRNGFQTRSGGEMRINGGFGSNGSSTTGAPPLADVVDSDIRRRVELLEKASHRNLDVNINKTPTPGSESRYARSGTVTGPGIENASGLHHPGASRGIAHQSLNYHPFGGNYHREGGGGGGRSHLLTSGGGGSSPGKNGNSYLGGKEIITLDDSPPGANGREDKVSPIPVMKLLNPEFRAMLGKTTKISPNKQFSAGGGGGDLSSPHAVARIESSLRENGRKSMPTSGLASVGSNGVVTKPVSTNGLVSTDIRNNNETHGSPLRSLNLNNSFSKTSPVSMGENHERMALNNKAVNLNVIVNNTRNLNNTTTATDVVNSSRKIINMDKHLDDDRKMDDTTRNVTNADRNEAENEQENLLNSRNNNFRMSPSRENAFGRDQNNMIIVNNLDSMDRNNEFLNNKNQRMSNGGSSFNNRILNEENNDDECFNNEGQVSRIRNDLFKKIDSENANKACENSNRSSSCEKSPRSSSEKSVDLSLNSKTSITSVVDSKNHSAVNVEELKQENVVSQSKLVTKDVLVKQINSASTNISISGSYSKESSDQQASQKHSITFNSFDSNEDISFNDIENNAKRSPFGNDTTMNEDISRLENSIVDIASKDHTNHVSSIDNDNFNSNAIRNETSKDISLENTAKDSKQTHSKEERKNFNDKEDSDVKEFKTDNKLSNDQNKKEINSEGNFKTDKNVPTFTDVKTNENAIDNDDTVNGNIVQQETSRQNLSPAKNITKSFIEAEREFVSCTNVNKSEDIDNQKVIDIKEDDDNLLKDSKNVNFVVGDIKDGVEMVHNIPNIKTEMKIDSIKNEMENFTTQIASNIITKDDSKTSENVLDFTAYTNSGAFKDEPSIINSNLSQDSTDFIVNKDISSGVKNISKHSENDVNLALKSSSFTVKDNATQFSEESSSNIKTIVKDGDYYKQLLSTDRKILTDFLNTFEKVISEHQLLVTSKETSDTSCDLSEDTVDKANNSPISSELEGQILLTIGQCKLLLNKKFPFFEKNCEKSLRQAAGDVTVTSAGTEELLILNEDLTGLWDTICIQIEEVRGKFEMLTKLRQNNWVPESGPKIDTLKSSAGGAAGKRSSLGNSNSGAVVGSKPLGRSIKSTSSLPKPRSANVSAKTEERKKFLEEKRKAMLEQKRKEVKNKADEEVDMVVLVGGEKEG